MKRDANEAAIVAHLRKLGFVVVLHDPGSRRGSQGEPDIFVFGNGKCVPMEIKMPGEKLNSSQVIFHMKVIGLGGYVPTVRTELDAEIAMGLVHRGNAAFGTKGRI